MGTHTRTAPRPAAATEGRELLLTTIAEHAPSLLATARRLSLCADDAQDAYQRGLEIFLRRAEDLHPEGASAWLRTVIRHEALAVRAARLRLVGGTEVDVDAQEARELPAVDDRAADFEQIERSAEALSRLKPHEVRALVLKAYGYSYEEIGSLTGWSYTKVNRCLSEGRRALRERLADIEAGRECERWADVLSAVADGEATAAQVTAVRPHLRACAGCRATLREYRMAQRGVAAVVPLGLLASGAPGGHGAPALVSRIYEAIAGGVHERTAVSMQKLQAGLDAASTGKLAAVAASATALAGSGVAVVEGPLVRSHRRAAHAVADAARHHRAPLDAAPVWSQPRPGGGEGNGGRGHADAPEGGGPAPEGKRGGRDKRREQRARTEPSEEFDDVDVETAQPAAEATADPAGGDAAALDAAPASSSSSSSSSSTSSSTSEFGP